MENQPNQPDGAIDKTLAALNAATPPEGMEARIAARIAAQPVSPWRDCLTGYTLASAWWRGAATGAAAAMLLAGVVLFASHQARVRMDAGHAREREGPAVRTLAPVAASTRNVSASRALATPCASPRVLPVRNTAPSRSIDAQRAEALAAINAPSHPAPVRPLTAQERALVELARTADPKMLVALSPETQAKVEAQEEENFNKFFAPPPAPPQPPATTSPTSPNENRVAPKEGEQI